MVLQGYWYTCQRKKKKTVNLQFYWTDCLVSDILIKSLCIYITVRYVIAAVLVLFATKYFYEVLPNMYFYYIKQLGLSGSQIFSSTLRLYYSLVVIT